MSAPQSPLAYPARRALVLGFLCLALALLVGRVVDLQVLRKDFLQVQGNARHLRVVQIAAHRGMITDRNGVPLAISTPVDSVWANPRELFTARAAWPRLARLLGIKEEELQRHLAARSARAFVYLKRRIDPELARQVMALSLPGVFLQHEYRRYYPTGEVTAHLLGFTGIDDTGQEGLELAYDEWLRGVPGNKRVIKDRLGHIVADVENLSPPRPGQDLQLSVDKRVQYLAYRELKAAVLQQKARAASAVILDVGTGEVLAMVNLPAYNPNKIKETQSGRTRNRAVTDVFEPGSTLKPFTIAAALETGQYRPDTPIDTTPGLFKVGRNLIRDLHDYGRIDVSKVIQKSSNVGASKIALSIPPERLWAMFSGVGFGVVTNSGFPGEASGLLPSYQRWRDLQRATLSFGYGLSVTALQLAQAYAALGDGGRLHPVSFLRAGTPLAATPVMREETALQVRTMLESVVSPEGTGMLAHVPGYRVAGKTGTVRKPERGGYAKARYLSLFAGLVPASHPRLAMVVVIDEPSRGEYYGGEVAAPVFSKVMTGAMRLLDVVPDDLSSLHLASQAEPPSDPVISLDAELSKPGAESPLRPAALILRESASGPAHRASAVSREDAVGDAE